MQPIQLGISIILTLVFVGLAVTLLKGIIQFLIPAGLLAGIGLVIYGLITGNKRLGS